ncbi:TadG family pilus assembly protein [Microvirga sp. 0TCS3.31]
MRQLSERIGTFWNDERGATAILAAPMMLVLLGMAALAVDTAQAYTTKSQLLTTAEAAAAAAVSTLPDRSAARSMAMSYARQNFKGSSPGDVVTASDIQIGHWNKSTKTFAPRADSEPANAVRITASRLQSRGNGLPTIFGNVLGVSLFDLSVSVVAMRYDGQPCINALAPSGIGVKINSNAAINTSNCPIHVHSAANDALSVDANASVTAEAICVKGSYVLRSKATAQPDPEISCPSPAQDPFVNVPPPSFGSSCTTIPAIENKTLTLNPGVYCGLTIKGNSTVTFSPGEYIIKDGRFTIESNANVIGDGVLFYLTGTQALLDFRSNVTINFTAPTEGPRAGIVFFQDSSYGGQHEFNSNVTAMINGAMYFPSGTLNLNSNSSIDTTSACLMIVSYRVNLDSNVLIESNSNVQSTTDSSFCPAPSNTRRSRIVS